MWGCAVVGNQDNYTQKAHPGFCSETAFGEVGVTFVLVVSG